MKYSLSLYSFKLNNLKVKRLFHPFFNCKELIKKKKKYKLFNKSLMKNKKKNIIYQKFPDNLNNLILVPLKLFND